MSTRPERRTSLFVWISVDRFSLRHRHDHVQLCFGAKTCFRVQKVLRYVQGTSPLRAKVCRYISRIEYRCLACGTRLSDVKLEHLYQWHTSKFTWWQRPRSCVALHSLAFFIVRVSRARSQGYATRGRPIHFLVACVATAAAAAAVLGPCPLHYTFLG